MLIMVKVIKSQLYWKLRIRAQELILRCFIDCLKNLQLGPILELDWACIFQRALWITMAGKYGHIITKKERAQLLPLHFPLMIKRTKNRGFFTYSCCFFTYSCY